MKKLCIALFIGISITWISCGNSTTEKTVEQNNQNPTGTVYTCPMHPEVKSDKPGQCPKCGMDLEVAKSPASADSTKK